MVGTAITGPLDVSVQNAGLDCDTKLQLGITRQREQWQRDLLQADIMALDVADPRRESCQSVDSLSSAWVAAWPSRTKGWALSEREFREVLTTYLGRESPCARELAGLPIQSNTGRRICDSHGRQLCLAMLPGDGFRARHDALADVVFRSALQSGLPGRVEPRRLFMHALPQSALNAFPTLGIIPDAQLTVNMGRGDGTRDTLFDVKTISAGGPTYARRYRLTGGAVAERARKVPGEYEKAARLLDLRHHRVVAPAVGRVLTALRTFPPVCGLAFGAYGEASSAVHTLLKACATSAAARSWARMGARSAVEAVGFFASSLRRRWGIVAVREYARLRLNRLSYVGAASGARSAQLCTAPRDADGVACLFSAAVFRAGIRAY
jgi:hypothetical protein